MKLYKFHIFNSPLFALYTIATPSPVAITGLVVVLYTLPAPPVAIKVVLARITVSTRFSHSVRMHNSNNIVHSMGYKLTQMMLSNNIYGEMVGSNFNIRMIVDKQHLIQFPYLLHPYNEVSCFQNALLPTQIIFSVELLSNFVPHLISSSILSLDSEITCNPNYFLIA